VEIILREGPISMAEAARLLGPRSTGKLRQPATVAGYCARGCRGVRLQGVYGPEGWITSAAAVQRFLAEFHARFAGTPAVDIPNPVREAAEAEVNEAANKARLAKVREQLRQKKPGGKTTKTNRR
jgi:hypothetical protein